jgi:hypothetical protein
VSCSAFLIEADADEATEFLKRRGEFRVQLRKFVTCEPSKLSEERYDWLVLAVDKAWAEIIPKPKAQSILDFLCAQFALSSDDDADAFDDYVVSLQEQSETNAALSADMGGADDAANLLIVETFRFRV